MAVPFFFNKLTDNMEMVRLLSSFTQSTGIPLRLMNFHGKKVWQSDICRGKTFFCHIPHPEVEGDRFCRAAHKKAVNESIRWGEATIRTCCHSFMQITAPIMDRGRLVGYLVASPFLLVDPADLQPDELPFLSSNVEKKRIFEKVLLSIPVVKDDEAGQAAKKLFQLADRFSHPDLGCLREVREIQELQGKIVDQIRDLKTIDRDLNSGSLTKLFYEQEKEIIAKIRLGDRIGAKEILYRLLAIILTQYLEKFELLKISILELIIILTRAAVEAGTKIEEVLGMRYRFITESASIKDQENLCIWVVQLLEKLMDGIYETRHAKNYQRLKKALDFIETNCGEPLTVEQIAKEVYLSSSRLSHIIRNELGMTLGNYISRVRIDKAKSLLKEKELPISQIALEVGFPDQSYFTKVFKKIERCTPKVFRRNSFQPLVLKNIS
jgi:two-component system response regulator YesN